MQINKATGEPEERPVLSRETPSGLLAQPASRRAPCGLTGAVRAAGAGDRKPLPAARRLGVDANLGRPLVQRHGASVSPRARRAGFRGIWAHSPFKALRSERDTP